MFKKFISIILNKKTIINNELNKKIVPIKQFQLSKKNISKEANKIIQTLNNAGFDAYIVGGAVRDLIVNYKPKDFDIVTNAKPNEVHAIFKRSKIIGRRFPIVHVYMGRNIIEVSTFRAYSNRINNHGRIIQDNIYGTMDQDASRRDFTCNALYFDPKNETIISYHDGIQHLLNKELIIIGDAATRFKEDPIRILRAIRIASKLNLTIAPPVRESMQQLVHFISNEPKPRLFDELVKILLSGDSKKCFNLLQEINILAYIHPITQTISEYHNNVDLLLTSNTLSQTDYRLKNQQTVSLGFVLAALLWPTVFNKWIYNKNSGLKTAHALHEAIIEVMREHKLDWDIPNKNIASINEIWRLQYRLELTKSKQQVEKIINQAKFRAAYDFFLLRASCGNADKNKAKWWTHFITLDNMQQNALFTKQPNRHKPKNKQLK